MCLYRAKTLSNKQYALTGFLSIPENFKMNLNMYIIRLKILNIQNKYPTWSNFSLQKLYTGTGST